jgi:ATP-binding cassette subfamily B (MDR/TAP) protein 1
VILLAAIAAIFAALAGVGAPKGIGKIFDSLESGEQILPLVQSLASMYMSQAALGIFSSAMISNAVQNICTALQILCCEAVLYQDVGSFRSAGGTSQQAMQVITTDVVDMCSGVKHVVTSGLVGLAGLIGSTISLVSLSPQLSVCMLGTIPVCSAIFQAFSTYIRSYSDGVRSSLAKAQAVMAEGIHNIHTVQSFVGMGQEAGLFQSMMQQSLEHQHAVALLRASFFACLQLAKDGVTALTLWVGASLVSGDIGSDTAGDTDNPDANEENGHENSSKVAPMMAKGDIQAFLTQTMQLVGSVVKLLKLATEMQSVNASAYRIEQLLDASSPTVSPSAFARAGVSASSNPLALAPASADADGSGDGYTGRISFEHVTFAYPTKQSHPANGRGKTAEKSGPAAAPKPVLNDLSITIEPGQVTTIVGASGSGKSTVVALIERFYSLDPSSAASNGMYPLRKNGVNCGEVLIDGRSIESIDRRLIRSAAATAAGSSAAPPLATRPTAGAASAQSFAGPCMTIGLVGQEPTLFPGTYADHLVVLTPHLPYPSTRIPFAFHFLPGTIADNIRFGDVSGAAASMGAVRQAAEDASAHAFIMRMPHGYETSLHGPSGNESSTRSGGNGSKSSSVSSAAGSGGSAGSGLSGGQKQRVAIARALLHLGLDGYGAEEETAVQNDGDCDASPPSSIPRMLILDDATSALDATSEKQVHDAVLKRLRLGKERSAASSDSALPSTSLLVITHRLGSDLVRGAEKIIVMHEGRAVEQGTHEELIRKPNGAYAKLVALSNQKKQQQEEVVTNACRE